MEVSNKTAQELAFNRLYQYHVMREYVAEYHGYGDEVNDEETINIEVMSDWNTVNKALTPPSEASGNNHLFIGASDTDGLYCVSLHENSLFMNDDGRFTEISAEHYILPPPSDDVVREALEITSEIEKLSEMSYEPYEVKDDLKAWALQLRQALQSRAGQEGETRADTVDIKENEK